MSPILNKNKEGSSINYSSNQNLSFIDQEDSEVQSELNESIDLLINKTEIQLQQILLKSYFNEEPQKILSKDMNIITSALNKVQEIIKNMYEKETQKSSLRLIYESISTCLLSFSLIWFYRCSNKDINYINKQIKNIKDNISKVKEQSPFQFMFSGNGLKDFLVCGKVNSNNIIEFGKYHTLHLSAQHQIINEITIKPNKLSENAISNLLSALFLNHAFYLSYDLTNLVNMKVGDEVFIIGNQLKGNLIRQFTIFKKINFSEFEQLKTTPQVKKLIFGLCGGVILVFSIYKLYKLYTLLKKRNQKI